MDREYHSLTYEEAVGLTLACELGPDVELPADAAMKTPEPLYFLAFT